MDYQDLVIRIAPWQADQYKVIVTDSPLGVTCTSSFRLSEDLPGCNKPLSLPGRDIGGMDTGTFCWDPEQIGKMLFRTLFQGKVRQVYERSRGRCERVRIKLVLEDEPRTEAVERLHGLPWELLNDGHFLETEADISIVRYMDSLADIQRLPGRRLRVLTLGATAVDLPTVNCREEMDSIRKELHGELTEMVYLPKVGSREISRADLHQTLGQGFHVLHFVGHGEANKLFFTNRDGTHVSVTGAQLAEEIRALPARIRPLLMILNACSTAACELGSEELHLAGALVKSGIPAVVAMRHPISNHAAIAFSSAFYRQLAVGSPLDDAMNAGRMAIKRDILATDEWATPVLFMSLKDGKIFHPREDAPAALDQGRPSPPDKEKSLGFFLDVLLFSFCWQLLSKAMKWFGHKMLALSWPAVALPATVVVAGGVYLGIESGLFTPLPQLFSPEESAICHGLVFDGGGDYVAMAEAGALNAIGTGDFTVETWFSAEIPNLDSSPVLMSNLTGNGTGLKLFFQATGPDHAHPAPTLQLANKSFLWHPPQNILDGTPHHLAVVKAGKKLTFILDGRTMKTFTDPDISVIPLASGLPLWIGRDRSDTSNPWRGNLYRLRIWKRALDEQEVRRHQRHHLRGDETGLVFLLRLDEGRGQGVEDLVDGGMGWLGGSEEEDGHDPRWIAGDCYYPIALAPALTPSPPVVPKPEPEVETRQSIAKVSPPIPGLMGWWACEWGPADQVMDQIGAHHGIRHPGAVSLEQTASSGRLGPQAGINEDGFWFDGKQGWLSLPPMTSADVSQGFTMSLWVWHAGARGLTNKKFSLLSQSAYPPKGQNISQEHAYPGFQIYLEGGYLGFQAGAGSQRSYPSNARIPEGHWRHVAFTYDGEQAIQFFVNGLAKGNRTLVGAKNFLNLTAPLTVGAIDGNGDFWHGAMDELKIFNRPLTASEVQSLFEDP